MKKFILIALALAALLTAGTVYAAQTKVYSAKPSVGTSTMPVMRGYATQTPPGMQPVWQNVGRMNGNSMQRGNMMYAARPIGGRAVTQNPAVSRGAMFTGAAVFVLFVISTIMLWVLMLLAIIALFKWIKKQD